MRYIWILQLLVLPLWCNNKTFPVEIDYCVDYTPIERVSYTQEDLLLLARLVYSESRGEGLLGQRAVAQVVVNRAKARNKSIRAVIFRKGRFDGVQTRSFNYYNDSTLEAARSVLAGRKVIPEDVLYFFNPKTSTDGRFIRKLTIYRTIGNHSFAWMY